jgi:type I restriction enzyme S subunit
VEVFIIRKKCWVTDNAIIGLPKVKGESEFWYFLLTKLQLNSYRSGSGQPLVNQSTLNSIPVEIPKSPSVRQAIGKQLFSFENKIYLNNQINQTLESIAQAIFKSWFIDFDPVRAKIAAKQEGKDPELAAMCAISGKSETELEQMAEDDLAELHATAALFPDELVESELGEVPKGWEYKKLKNLCRVINGRAYKNTEFKDEGIPIVRIQNLTGGGKTVFSDLDLPQDKLIEKEDFIYAWSATFGPYIWRGPKVSIIIIFGKWMLMKQLSVDIFSI